MVDSLEPRPGDHEWRFLEAYAHVQPGFGVPAGDRCGDDCGYGATGKQFSDVDRGRRESHYSVTLALDWLPPGVGRRLSRAV